MILNDDMAKLLVKTMSGKDAEDVVGQDKKYLFLTGAQIKMSTTCAKLFYYQDIQRNEWPV